MARLTLWINHLIASEPAAIEHLVRHAGRSVELQADALAPWVPAPPALVFRVTPAGLLEWVGDASVPVGSDLQMVVDASNPAQSMLAWLGGRRPGVVIKGNAGFAADINWVVENLRWDAQDDLARVFGPVVADGLARWGAMLAAGLRRTVRSTTTFFDGANGPLSR
ncbi:hypothetical protein [Methylibium sp.]|uniref:hypothetical protein n=1 Tax=Methylibium sp. TaxID=2067992 RepID=UPI003D0D8714